MYCTVSEINATFTIHHQKVCTISKRWPNTSSLMSCFYSKVCKVKPLIRCSKKYLENIPPKTSNHQNIKPEKVDADRICWQNETFFGPWYLTNALPSSLLSRADKFNLLIRCCNKCFENYPLILPKLVNIKPVRDARYVEIATYRTSQKK